MEIIAFYLPQYHPTPSNDEWWGKGFTEWTNVAKAKPLYPGHYQPKIPADLGFYDLRLPQTRASQADLARMAGITGFCYYHYWFGDGHVELELPFNEVVESKEPNFPFMLCWANESWYKKFWSSDGSVASKSTLAEQKYLGEADDIMHFNYLRNAFTDERYIRIDGRLAFMIYKPLEFPAINEFIKRWNKLAAEAGLGAFYFIAYSLHGEEEYGSIKSLGFDAVCSSHHGYGKQSKFSAVLKKLGSSLFHIPRLFSYQKMIPQLVSDFERRNNDVYPVMIPNWDHSPRSKDYAYVYHGATPELFRKHAKDVLNTIKNKENKHQICFLKSWNEWGEGNYMEPDLRFGHGWLNALKMAIEEVFTT